MFLLWCDNRRDTFLITAQDLPGLRRLTTVLRSSYRARVLVVEGNSALFELPDFEWAKPPSVTGLARRGGVWVLPPVVYAEGRETYRLVAPTRSRLNGLIRTLRRLGEVEILSVGDRVGLDAVRDFPTASVHFFEGLSERQTRALVAAHDAGLLEIPARASWQAVAGREGVARSTFGEHLRKGQLRLLQNSYSMLRARLSSGESPPILLPALGGPAAGSSRRRRARSDPARDVRTDPSP